jgi:hypothetical protein
LFSADSARQNPQVIVPIPRIQRMEDPMGQYQIHLLHEKCPMKACADTVYTDSSGICGETCVLTSFHIKTMMELSQKKLIYNIVYKTWQAEIFRIFNGPALGAVTIG